MPTTRRALYRLFVAVLVVCGLVQLTTFGVSTAELGSTAQGYVKYYTVTAVYQGAPEQLTEIAVRFLGSGERSAEIYNLNSGRPQPDGAGLADPGKLHAGWVLVLPWDAAGDGVRYGLLPGTKSAGAPSPRPSTPGSATPTPTGSKRPANNVGGPGAASCVGVTASSKQSDWAQLRMAPDQAWERTRGNGVMVAVVDSGVDSTLPQLSGRVAVGADITSGTGRGDTDCVGSGTAMASIIAGSADQGGTPMGIAPDATILPIRVVSNGSAAKSADEAAAIEVAVSTGASVVAAGSFVDLKNPAVAAAVANALSHDVLVVVAAPTEPVTLPSANDGSAAGALLSVGGVGADGQVAAAYQESVVDVVAPGIDVASLGANGTGKVANSGSQYAVAFVAGQAALVRAAYPGLTAAQVKHRIEATADRMGNAPPDKQYGWGMINPTSAVTATVANEPHAAPPRSSGTGGGVARTVVIAVVMLILFAALGMLLLRGRQRTRAAGDIDDDY